jgi:leader peptidase (prepilin peptidase)/N-methyltransferase
MSPCAVAAGTLIGAVLAPAGLYAARRTASTVLHSRHEVCLVIAMALVGGAAASWQVPLLAPTVLLGVLGVPAVVVDAVEHRIPDRLSLPLAGGVLVALACAGQPAQLLDAVAGGAVWTALLLATFLATGQPGPGDVKLAPSLGLLASWTGWNALIASIAFSYMLAGLIAVVGMLGRRLTLCGRLPLGPPMMAATILSITLWH